MKRTGLLLAAVVVAAAAAWWGFAPAGRDAPGVAALAKQMPTAAADTRSRQTLARSDLPPEGTRSLFDHLVAQAGGVPYPFEKLLRLVEQQAPNGEAPVTVMIPEGRSLLKGVADYTHPRVLAAADFQAPNTPASLGLAPRGQLFLGFVENAGEIEVISYNEAAGRYEFQLVQDYTATGARKLVYAQRAICLTCHQGAAPLFPQRPWNETNGQPETAARIAEARRAAGLNPDQYLGLPVAAPLSAPERFDELTDVGNFVAVTQTLWLDQCGDAACRRSLLKLALAHAAAPGDFRTDSPAADALRAQQAAAGAAPIAVPESDIANRDPLGEASGIKGFFRRLLAPRAAPGAGARNNEDLAAFDALPPLPPEQDPLSLRAPKRLLTARDLDAVYGLSALFTADDIRTLEAAAGYQWARVEKAIDALPTDLFADAPFSRVRTLQALHTGLSPAAAPGFCCWDTADMSPPIASGEPPLVLAAASPLQPFVDYCFACHRGNPAKRLNFMSGASEDAVLAAMREKTDIRDVLDWPRYVNTDKAGKLMPPADSAQHAALVEALKTRPGLRDEMIAVVPGLFDF